MHEVYRDGLERHLHDPRFEMPWPANEKGNKVKAEVGRAVLEALVSPEDHRILRLHHHRSGRQEGFAGHLPQERAVLNALCEVSLGYSVQDVSEHAVIRTESLLRGTGARPVAGVVQPLNADPMFEGPLRLVRELLRVYMDEHGFTLGMNIEEGPASRGFSEWGTSAVDDRKQRILAALPEICPETGVPRDLVRVELVEGPRVTLSLSRTIPEADKGRYLLLQELHLRTTVDPRIELFLHDRKDANAKRQGVL